MELIKVRFTFDNDNTKVVNIEAENQEELLYRLTSQDWYISKDNEVAINLKLVTRITFPKRKD
jgi:hypothetical protein